MRRTLLVGAVLTVVATLVVLVSDLLDLKLESVTLLGVALGAVIGLVPDRSPLMRLVGFLAGLAIAWVGYLLRAGVFPDSVAGRAVSVGLVLALCVAVAALSFDRIPLWSTLLGAAALVGAYEYTYAAAPPEALSSSLSTVTALLITTAVGFLAVSLLEPRTEGSAHRPDTDRGTHNDRLALDDMMEKSQ
jgi:hypothetical protein